MLPRRLLALQSPFSLWLIVAIATLVTWQVGEQGASGLAITSSLFALAIYKGSLIANHFMRLNQAPRLWQTLVLSWLILTCSLILLAYYLGGK